MNEHKEVSVATPKLSYSKVFSYAGAFIALLIGSGFATGQELMQYFAAYGPLGFVGILIVLIFFSIIGVELIYAGYHYRFDNPNDIYQHYLGKWIGKAFDIFAVIFLFLSYTVMVAGASATAVEHYQAPSWLGGALMAAVVIFVVTRGLNQIVDVIGTIGPLIVLLTIIVGIISTIRHLDALPHAAENLQMARQSGQMQIASVNFFLSAISYIGFCLIWLAAFVSGIGKNARSIKEGSLGIALGALGFSLACAIMTFAIYLSLDTVYDSQIPVLKLAGEIHPWLATVFSIIIFLGIFTTAVPLLWNVVARFVQEGTSKYRFLTLVLGVVGAIVGLALNFSELVNIVYVLNGYIGAIMMVIVMYHGLKHLLHRA